MKALTVEIEALETGAQRHESLAAAMYAIEQRLRATWMRLSGAWQSYVREDVETYCAHALNEAGHQSAVLRALGGALGAAAEHLVAGDVAAAGSFEEVTVPVPAPESAFSTSGRSTLHLPLVGFLPTTTGTHSIEIGSAPAGAVNMATSVPADSGFSNAPPGAPGGEVSTAETIVLEHCVETDCVATTMQGSTGITPNNSIGSIEFQFGSNLPSAFELTPGLAGGITMGRLALSMTGAEWTTLAPGSTIERRLENGVVLRVYREIVQSGASVYTDQSGVSHMAAMSGSRYVASMVTSAGAATVAGALTVRQYAWRDSRRSSDDRKRSQDEAERKRRVQDSNEPRTWEWPNITEFLDRLRRREQPKTPIVPVPLLVP